MGELDLSLAMKHTDQPLEEVPCRGMRFPIIRSVLNRKLRVQLRSEGYEQKEANAALKLIRKDDVVLELGGGIGFMSTLIATQTDAAWVHSYEPNTKLVPYIRNVHALNNVTNATATNALLGTDDGETTFYLRRNVLSSSLSPDVDPDGVTPIPVPVLNANRIVSTLKPTVLVCDIEGAEQDLLPAMDLSGFRAVLIELHPQWIGREGIRAVFRKLDDAGLVFFPRWSEGKVAVFRSDW